jgi:hypothetical protein
MRQTLLPSFALLAICFATPTFAQTRGYEETGLNTKPNAFQGCGTLAQGANGPTSGKIATLADIPPRLRAADKVRLKHAYRMARHEVAMNPGGSDLPAQAKPRITRLAKLQNLGPTACPDSAPLRLTR